MLNENKQFEAMARRCAMGDLTAMLWMWEHFHGQLNQETLSLEEDFLRDPTAESWNRLASYCNEHKEESIQLQAAAFWLCRASLYGSPRAAALLEQKPAREHLSFLSTASQRPGQGRPRRQRIPGDVPLMSYCGAEVYVRQGLPDLAGAVEPMDKNGFYRSQSYAGYEGADETGYGMEEEYNFFYYDEFFQLLTVRKGWSNLDIRNNADRILAECEAKRTEKQQEREAFWRHAPQGEAMERYHPLQ